jgi:hypothetical protein
VCLAQWSKRRQRQLRRPAIHRALQGCRCTVPRTALSPWRTLCSLPLPLPLVRLQLEPPALPSAPFSLSLSSSLYFGIYLLFLIRPCPRPPALVRRRYRAQRNPGTRPSSSFEASRNCRSPREHRLSCMRDIVSLISPCVAPPASCRRWARSEWFDSPGR